MDSKQRQSFNSVEDECRYWKERAQKYYAESAGSRREFIEYVEQSREKEVELIAMLDEKQDIINNLKLNISLLEDEKESERHRIESQRVQLTNIELQMGGILAKCDTMRKDIRQLEKKNSNIESVQRILHAGLADANRMLEKEYEKNAFLELQVEEKLELQEKLQKLMIETQKEANDVREKSTSTSDIRCNCSAKKSGKYLCNSASSPQLHQGDDHEPSQNLDEAVNDNEILYISRTNVVNIVDDILTKLEEMQTNLETYLEPRE